MTSNEDKNVDGFLLLLKAIDRVNCQDIIKSLEVEFNKKGILPQLETVS